MSQPGWRVRRWRVGSYTVLARSAPHAVRTNDYAARMRLRREPMRLIFLQRIASDHGTVAYAKDARVELA